jgi:ABC-type transport system involved in multi-copper enzyme maturation permease subunit
MLRILAVAVNTFREAVRDRVLNGLLGVALVVLVFTLALAELSLDQRRRIVLDIGLASISLFSVVMAVFLGSSLLYKEIERKTLYVILPKPIGRHEFLFGKYLGIVLTGFVFIAVMGALQLMVTTLQQTGPSLGLLAALLGLPGLLGALMYWARDRSAVLVPWSALALLATSGLAAQGGVELWPILAALLLTIGEVLVLSAVALVFSAFSTPFLTALFTTGVWLVGRSADMMISMKAKVMPDLVRAVLRKLAMLWPNFNLFVPGPHTLHVQPDAASTPGTYVVSTMLYAIMYASLLLAFAALIFRRRDFL